MASGQDAHRGERPPRTARDASRGSRCPGRTSSHPGGTGVKKWGGAGRDPSYKMGEGIVFSTVFFWRLRPEIGSNCHPVGSSSKTPSDALQAFSMETGQAGGESVAECGSGGRFSAGGRFYQVTSAIEHNGHYVHRILGGKPQKIPIFLIDGETTAMLELRTPLAMPNMPQTTVVQRREQLLAMALAPH